jgi:hypothetical protein
VFSRDEDEVAVVSVLNFSWSNPSQGAFRLITMTHIEGMVVRGNHAELFESVKVLLMGLSRRPLYGAVEVSDKKGIAFGQYFAPNIK